MSQTGKLRIYEQLTTDGQPDGKAAHFWCNGCGERHCFNFDRPAGKRPNWTFDGDTAVPTFSPSLLYQVGDGKGGMRTQCHLFLTAGKIHFLNDCAHALRGQTVDMVDFPEGHP